MIQVLGNMLIGGGLFAFGFWIGILVIMAINVR